MEDPISLSLIFDKGKQTKTHCHAQISSHFTSIAENLAFYVTSCDTDEKQRFQQNLQNFYQDRLTSEKNIFRSLHSCT